MAGGGDGCRAGGVPGLSYGVGRGMDELRGFEELRRRADEIAEPCIEDGKPLPPTPCGRGFANKTQDAARNALLYRLRKACNLD